MGGGGWGGGRVLKFTVHHILQENHTLRDWCLLSSFVHVFNGLLSQYDPKTALAVHGFLLSNHNLFVVLGVVALSIFNIVCRFLLTYRSYPAPSKFALGDRVKCEETM